MVTSADDEDDDDKGEMASVVLMVREGRDLLQHMQLSPWPENLPADSNPRTLLSAAAKSRLTSKVCGKTFHKADGLSTHPCPGLRGNVRNEMRARIRDLFGAIY